MVALLNRGRKIGAKALRAVARRIDMPANVAAADLDQEQMFFKCLTRLGFAPRHVVDIGANRGRWTDASKRFFPEAHFTLLEPNPDLHDELRRKFDGDSKVTIHQVGAGASDGTMAFTKHERADSGSFAPTAEQAEARNFERITLPIVKLDTLLIDAALPPPDMIKIDAEGIDLDVIDGARKSIEASQVVLVEAAIMNKAFANELKLVVDKLDELGFRPFDITEFVRTHKHAALWLVEVAFVRRDGPLDTAVDSYA